MTTTNSGDINFNGTIDSRGTYQFQTNNGTVNVALPSTPAFHVDASTNSGSIDIPGVQNTDSGTKASGNIGGSSQGTNVTIKSDSGDINLH